MPASDLEEAFAVWCRAESIPPAVREHAFHPKRKWRFDFAWPDRMVAVEIEGGIMAGMRHQKAQGYMADAEKYLEAQVLGWTVVRVPGPWVAEGERMIWRPQVMDALKHFLGL